MYSGVKMKISSINYYNKPQTTFNGIWGKTIKSYPDYDPVIATNIITQTATYFPFADETQEQIDEVVNQTASSAIIRDDTGKRQLLVRNCVVGPKMKVNQNYYDEYVKLKDIDNISRELTYTHAFVRDKYLDSGFEDPEGIQKPAINKAVYNAFERKKAEKY